MTNGDPRQRFLEIEAQADELVKALENLKSEAENYQTSAERLDEVGASIKSTLEGMTVAVAAMKETAAKLNEIGTPEILASQDTLATAISEIDARLGGIESMIAELGVQSKRSLLLRLITFR